MSQASEGGAHFPNVDLSLLRVTQNSPLAFFSSFCGKTVFCSSSELADVFEVSGLRRYKSYGDFPGYDPAVKEAGTTPTEGGGRAPGGRPPGTEGSAPGTGGSKG